jgi:hypothetical protein
MLPRGSIAAGGRGAALPAGRSDTVPAYEEKKETPDALSAHP